ncbi:MAG TPA: hypothetical protein VH933_02720 [Aestuariivirgaceae bacterium]
MDAKIVHREQTALQGMLDTLKESNPTGYETVIGDMNSILNPTGLTAFGAGLDPTDRAYSRILDSVRQGLGRNIDFAIQSDREAIGNAVIDHVRSTGGCDVTGSRIKRC